MRILMFGWEFPPHISGGLGTACFGLTRGLAKHHVEVIFVVPKAYGDEDQQSVRIVNASDMRFDLTDEEHKEFWQRIKYMEVGSNIIPYVAPENFEKVFEEKKKTGESFASNVFSKEYKFENGYRPNLIKKVSRYALIASALALKKDFDIIHTHN